jgi:hypothetical protein
VPALKKQKLLGFVFLMAAGMDAIIAFLAPQARIPLLISAGAMAVLGAVFLARSGGPGDSIG